jgi:hypothetical protein
VTAPLSECPNPFAVYMTEALGSRPLGSIHGGSRCSATEALRADSAIRDGHCEVAVVLSATLARCASYGATVGIQDPPGVQGPPATLGC